MATLFSAVTREKMRDHTEYEIHFSNIETPLTNVRLRVHRFYTGFGEERVTIVEELVRKENMQVLQHGMLTGLDAEATRLGRLILAGYEIDMILYLKEIEHEKTVR